ncbi:MAG: hypothetical protein NTW19_11275 [Planctomycetota bacterium]|nr:hypothetical protein [Planctomycetota bacterium]
MALCLALAAVWIHSHQMAESALLVRNRDEGTDRVSQRTSLGCEAGLVGIVFGWRRSPASMPVDDYWFGPGGLTWQRHVAGSDAYVVDRTNHGMSGGRFLGFTYRRLRRAVPEAEWNFTTFAVPLWFLVALTSALPLAWARATWREAAQDHRQRWRGRCSNCGYDLRGSAGDCPECGQSRATPTT